MTGRPVPPARPAPSASPAPAVQVQVTALRTAFPDYTFNLIRHRDDTVRFEALSRDGGDPYCLISDDAAEIWQALRAKG